jgi:hypothetical protein
MTSQRRKVTVRLKHARSRDEAKVKLLRTKRSTLLCSSLKPYLKTSMEGRSSVYHRLETELTKSFSLLEGLNSVSLQLKSKVTRPLQGKEKIVKWTNEVRMKVSKLLSHSLWKAPSYQTWRKTRMKITQVERWLQTIRHEWFRNATSLDQTKIYTSRKAWL